MSGDDLFRTEAVQDYLRARTRGQLLRISPAWAGWLYRVIAVTALSAAAFVAFAPLDRWVRGTAVVVDAGGSREVVAFMPQAERDRLAPGQTMVVHLGAGAPPLRLRVATVPAGIIGPSGARALLGDAADFVDLSRPSVLLRAAVPSDAAPSVAPHSSGPAEILVGRGTLLEALLPGARP